MGAFRTDTQTYLQGPHKTEVASISERGDDETWAGTQVLVAVDVLGSGTPHDAVVNVHLPVVAQLPQPLKVGRSVHTHRNLVRVLKSAGFYGVAAFKMVPLP